MLNPNGDPFPSRPSPLHVPLPPPSSSQFFPPCNMSHFFGKVHLRGGVLVALGVAVIPIPGTTKLRPATPLPSGRLRHHHHLAGSSGPAFRWVVCPIRGVWLWISTRRTTRRRRRSRTSLRRRWPSWSPGPRPPGPPPPLTPESGPFFSNPVVDGSKVKGEGLRGGGLRRLSNAPVFVPGLAPPLGGSDPGTALAWNPLPPTPHPGEGGRPRPRRGPSPRRWRGSATRPVS